MDAATWHRAVGFSLLLLMLALTLYAGEPSLPDVPDKHNWEINKSLPVMLATSASKEMVELQIKAVQQGIQPISRVVVTRASNTWRSPWLPAWKMRAVDIDGDGRAELLVALSMSDPRDGQLRNRLHIFSWEDGSLVDRWRGSYFPRPYVDFEALPSRDGKPANIVLLEIDPKDRHFYRATYQWLHFGLVLLRSTPVSCTTPPPGTALESWYFAGALDQCEPA